MERQIRLNRLREKVCVSVAADPMRVLRDTEAYRSRLQTMAGEEREKELQAPLFVQHGYTQDQVRLCQQCTYCVSRDGVDCSCISTMMLHTTRMSTSTALPPDASCLNITNEMCGSTGLVSSLLAPVLYPPSAVPYTLFIIWHTATETSKNKFPNWLVLTNFQDVRNT